MSEKCCPRADVVSTHWEGCHTIHPECAAWRAGREAGLREAAKIADGVEAEFLRESTLPDLTGTYSKHCGACASGAGSVEVAILAAIGDGEMSDLTKRLRESYISTGQNYVQEAADRIDALEECLRNIAYAKPSAWEPDVRDQFQEWAQNKARALLEGK